MKIIDRQYQGDPFLTLVEQDGKRYVINEAAQIESEERLFAEWDFGLRPNDEDRPGR